MNDLITKNNTVKDIEPLAVEYQDGNQFYDVSVGWFFYYKDSKGNSSGVQVDEIQRIIFTLKREATACAKIFKQTYKEFSLIKNQKQYILAFDKVELKPEEIIIKQFNSDIYANIILKNNETISKIQPGEVSYEDEFRYVDTKTGKYLNDTINFGYTEENNHIKYINQKHINSLILVDRKAALKIAKKFKITKRHIFVIHTNTEYQIFFDRIPEAYLNNKVIKEYN